MNIPRILQRVYGEPWSIREEAHLAIRTALDRKLSGALPDATTLAEIEEPEFNAPANIEVIPVYGIIGKHLSMLETMCGGFDLDYLMERIDAAEGDDSIDAVAFDFDSPGGTVTGIPEAAEAIAMLAAAKDGNVIGFTDSMCCSAAYWLMSQCPYAYAAPSASVGSIGVKAYILDQSRALANDGLVVNSFSSGKFKTMGDSYRPMTDDEKRMMEDRVASIGADFRAAVTSMRKIGGDCMEGQSFFGKDAVAFGLIDGLATDLDDVFEKVGLT